MGTQLRGDPGLQYALDARFARKRNQLNIKKKRINMVV
jgi:hypothetical protein